MRHGSRKQIRTSHGKKNKKENTDYNNGKFRKGKVMLTHIALFRFKKNLEESEKRLASVKLKSGFENLAGKIDGMISIKVENLLPSSSNVDMVVMAQFETKEALQNYHTSPLAFNFRNVLDENLEKTYTADFIA